MKGWVETRYTDVKRLVIPILEWLLWSFLKGINEDTSASETEIIVVKLPYQNPKDWQKLRLEGTIDKWPETQQVSEHQRNAGSAVAAATSMSVSQAEII